MAPRNGSAREQARRMQQEQDRRQKRQSLLLRIGVVVLALVVVAGLTVWVLARDGGDSYTEGPAPAAANEQGGMVLTSSTEIAEGDALGQVDAENIEDAEITGEGDLPPGVGPREEGEPPHVLTYTDAGCPACGAFESAYHTMLTEWVEAGAITLEVRSVSWVSPPYSAQTANAFACMAEESPESYYSYFGQITSARADGGEFSNDEMASIAEEDHGVDIAECINDGTYRAFSQYTTNLASANGIQATPTIFVDDEEVPEFMNTGEVILEAVQEYQEETGQDLVDEVEEDLEEVDTGSDTEQTEPDDDDDQ